jgi:hypothetical protein
VKFFTGKDETPLYALKKSYCTETDTLSELASINLNAADNEDHVMSSSELAIGQMFTTSAIKGCLSSLLSLMNPASAFLGSSSSSSCALAPSKILGDAKTYMTALENRDEDRLSGDVLNSIAQAVSIACPSVEDNTPYILNYSRVVEILTIFVVGIGYIISIPIGLLYLLISLPIRVFYYQFKEDETEDETEERIPRTSTIMFLIACFFLFIFLIRKSSLMSSLLSSLWRNNDYLNVKMPVKMSVK